MTNPEQALLAVLNRWPDDPDRDWTTQALCAQTDPDTFFPEKGGSTDDAKRMCARCPVTTECLEEALANDERFGVWGGLSERERRVVKRERRSSSGTGVAA